MAWVGYLVVPGPGGHWFAYPYWAQVAQQPGAVQTLAVQHPAEELVVMRQAATRPSFPVGALASGPVVALALA